jgi:TPR repeat protein
MNRRQRLLGLLFFVCCFTSLNANKDEVKSKVNNKVRKLDQIVNSNISIIANNSNLIKTDNKNEKIAQKDEKLKLQLMKKEKYANSLYEKALTLLNKTRPKFKKAYNLLRESAKLNHKKSKEMVAKSYLFGDYLPFDFKVAKQYFTSLSLNESSISQMFLGFMYSIGLGVDMSQTEALKYYRIAASVDNTFAQMTLAFRHKFAIYDCESTLNLYQKVATKVVKDNSGGAIIQTIRLLDEFENLGSVYNLFDRDLIQYFQFLAKREDVEAQMSLGHFYYYFDRDKTRALNYLQKAAKAGNGNALAFLGKIHSEGSHPFNKSNEIALQYFREAAEKGNPIGQSGLGLMYLYGRGVYKNHLKAFEYFLQSARQGWVEGQLYLGLMYLNGLSVNRNYQLAFKYFTLASKSNHLLGFFNLAQMFASGLGIKKSCTTAVQLFKKVAERGYWALILTEALDDYRSRRIAQAFIKYAFLSELGYEVAQSNAAFILENNEIEELFNKNESQRLAFMYWTRSAFQGYSKARLKLGDYHFYGYGTQVDYQMAANQYKKASEAQFNAQALFNLGFMHEKGLGLKRDLRLAQLYYDLSAQTSSDAEIPVALAKIKLRFIHRLESFLGYYSFDLSKLFGPNWDMYLATGLAIILVFILYIKLRNA